MLDAFDRFTYPDYAAAVFLGILMVAASFVLFPLDINPFALFLLRYLGLLIGFWGVVWYLFNWFIDHGVKYFP